jgi:hypothetical protein
MAGVRATLVRGRVRADPVVAGLVLVVAVAAALRFATIGHESWWFDEAHTVRLARAPFGGYALGSSRIHATNMNESAASST